jgi:pyruvate dehydrogenase E2 component (dihydrolipoamide acetyltransferase)
MEDGTLTKWRVKPGDTVRVGDVIAEVETEKAMVEMEAVTAGVIEELLIPDGTAGVKVNTPIARMQGDAPSGSAPRPQPAAAAPSNDKVSGERAKDVPVSSIAVAVAASPAAGGGLRGRIFASPVARRMARAAKIDLHSVVGTGPGGRITKRDIESFSPGAAVADHGVSSSPTVVASGDAVQALSALGIAPGTYDLVPLDGMRKAIARRMTESFRDVPHFPLTIHVEVDDLLQLRTQVNASLEKQGVKVSVNDMLIKAVAVALMHVPAANASYTTGGLALHHHADISFAVALESGLITPIVRSADTKSLSTIARETKELAQRARDKRLTPDQFQGGTFSVSNLGMFGISSFASILNAPQGCIMSVGAVEQRVVVKDGKPAVASMMTLTLTCDHRVVDGAIGARFLVELRELIAAPATMLV